jgi:hypothetical protein
MEAQIHTLLTSVVYGGFMIQLLYLSGKTLVLGGQEAGWALEPVWTLW